LTAQECAHRSLSACRNQIFNLRPGIDSLSQAAHTGVLTRRAAAQLAAANGEVPAVANVQVSTARAAPLAARV
jgi:hypothetical protein